jgi:hypothetical protein
MARDYYDDDDRRHHEERELEPRNREDRWYDERRGERLDNLEAREARLALREARGDYADPRYSARRRRSEGSGEGRYGRGGRSGRFREDRDERDDRSFGPRSDEYGHMREAGYPGEGEDMRETRRPRGGAQGRRYRDSGAYDLGLGGGRPGEARVGGEMGRLAERQHRTFGDDEAYAARQMGDTRLSRREPYAYGYTGPGAGLAEPRQTHRGKGPKGYRRSDERIAEDVSDALTDDHDLDASEIEIEVKEREVTLNGKVTSRADKRAAEDLAHDVSGVTHVQNNLRIESRSG